MLLLSCQNKEQEEATDNPAPVETVEKLPEETIETTPLQQQMKGVWTDETTADGVFEVTDTTFYYAENFVDYPYTLNGSRITIHYPDYTYEAEISIVNDTLRMESEEQGLSVFWRYGN